MTLSALSSAPPAHSRMSALMAIAGHLNTARQVALSEAQSAYRAEYGRDVDFPPLGPVLPICLVDDPVDDVLDQTPDAKPKILRRLSLISGSARKGQIVSNDMDEPIHNHELEWVIISPAEYSLATVQSIFSRGIKEIETILSPLRYSGLIPSSISPSETVDAPRPSSAISFEFQNVEYLAFDLGDHRAFSATISIELILDAISILS